MQLLVALEGYWLAREREFSPNTVRDYRLTFSRLVEHLGGEVEFERITSEHIHRFLNHCQKSYGLSNKTLCNTWIALSSLWSWAETELGVAHVIRKHVPRPRFHRAPIEPYSEEQVRCLLEACDQTVTWRTPNQRTVQSARPSALRDRAILVTLVDTGVRASELGNFKIQDYDPKTGRLHVRQGKGKKDRHVFLGQAGRRVLWRYLATRPNARGSEPLFLTRDGGALDRTSLRHLVDRIGERAGVPDAFAHRFRHTFAVNFLRNGGNVLELQRLLGHESLDTVNIYVRLAQSDLSNAQRVASPADNWRL